jgi:aminoglycoside 6'-N-acetyltransferase
VGDLTGSRVVLRPLAPEHADPLRAIRRQPEVAEWWGELEEGFPDEEPTARRFAVLEEGRVVGMIQATEENEPDYPNAEIDIFLAAGARGRGLGPDAIGALARHLIEDRGHHRIVLSAHVDNARAIRCYEKSGFRTVGTLRLAGRDYRTGGFADELLMELVVDPAG